MPWECEKSHSVARATPSRIARGRVWGRVCDSEGSGDGHSLAATQQAAMRFYRSLGFESFGREPRALKIGERYVDEEYMILRK